MVALALQDKRGNLRHAGTVVIQQDGGRNLPLQTASGNGDSLRNPWGVAIWVVIFLLANVGINGWLGYQKVGQQSGISHGTTAIASHIQDKLLDIALSQWLQEFAAVGFYQFMARGKLQVFPEIGEFPFVPQIICQSLRHPVAEGFFLSQSRILGILGKIVFQDAYRLGVIC